MAKERQSSIHNDAYRGIIDILAEARVRAGITQSELAQLMGMSQSDISKIEGYERRLDVLEALDMIRVICQGNEKQSISLWKKLGDGFNG